MNEPLHVVCPACNAVNRVPAGRLDQAPICGICKRSLFNGQPIELTAENFDAHTTRSDVPVVVDFWAAWCGPCGMMAPHFARAAAELEPRMRFAKLDTEAAQEIAGRTSDSERYLTHRWCPWCTLHLRIAKMVQPGPFAVPFRVP